MNKQFTITFGIDKDKDGSEVAGEQIRQARAEAEKRLTSSFGGCTSYEGIGSWSDPDNGRVFHEKAVSLVILTDKATPRGTIYSVARGLRDTLNQQCVLVVEQTVLGQFV